MPVPNGKCRCRGIRRHNSACGGCAWFLRDSLGYQHPVGMERAAHAGGPMPDKNETSAAAATYFSELTEKPQ